MLSKLKLLNADQYQLKVAVEYITKMLVDFVQGKSHYREVGSEQDTIDKWDDLVIISSNGEYIYVQIKRQTTGFSADSIERGCITKGTNKGNTKELSEFDKVFESFGQWVFSNSSCKSKFRLILPDLSIKIKKKLEIRHLTEFKSQIRKGITTKEGLKTLIESDTASKNIFIWLTTWCGFKDENHIIKAFNLLEFEMLGLDSDIEKRIKENLKNIFIDSESENIYFKLLSYVQENIVFTGSIKPRQLLYLLQNDLRPEIQRWTLFKTNGSNWTISGIQDLEDNNEVERSTSIVNKFWIEGNPYVRNLKIYGDYIEGCCISESLLRFSAHPQTSFDIICSNESSWKNALKVKTGGTLGVDKADLKDLRILNRLDNITQSDKRELDNVDSIRKYGEELCNEMYRNTLNLIDKEINSKLRTDIDNKGDLAGEVEKRWKSWKSSFEDNLGAIKGLLSKILHPKAEGESISGEIRVGPKTVGLLGEAIFLLLVVSVCLDYDNNKDWASVADTLKMTSIGLAYWSGPASSTNKLIKIDDSDGIIKLLENEYDPIIIISKSTISETEIFSYDITSDLDREILLNSPKHPQLLLTQNPIFSKLVHEGNITKLKEYFVKRLDQYSNVTKKAINEVVGVSYEI